MTNGLRPSMHTLLAGAVSILGMALFAQSASSAPLFLSQTAKVDNSTSGPLAANSYAAYYDDGTPFKLGGQALAGKTLIVQINGSDRAASAANGTYNSAVGTAIDGKKVTFSIDLSSIPGGFTPRMAYIYGARQGQRPGTPFASSLQSEPNRTWKKDGNTLTLEVTPVPMYVQHTNPATNMGLCSVYTQCGDDSTMGQAIVSPILVFADLNSPFVSADVYNNALGLTVSSNANTIGAPVVNTSEKSISAKLASPHLSTSGAVIDGYLDAFFPAALANSPAGWGIPNAEEIRTKLQVLRDNAAVTPTIDIWSDGGSVSGIFVGVNGFHFSTPNYTYKGPSSSSSGGGTSGGGTTGGGSSGSGSSGGGSAGSGPPSATSPGSTVSTTPSRPTGKISVVKKKRIVMVAIKGEAGVSYSISAQNAKNKKARAKSGSCSAGKKDAVTCSVKLAKGSWVVSVTPSRSGTPGPALSKTVKVK